MSQKLLNRIFSAIAAFSLLVNSLSAPLAVYAQTTTPEPTAAEITPTPIPTVTATPIATPTDTPPPTPTATPTKEPSPTPTDTQEPEEQGTLDANPLTDAAVEQPKDSSPGYDLNEPETEGTSAQLNPSISTDKADYFPTDTVLISGTGFAPKTSYTIEITSETGNYKSTDTVTSDESGGLFYSFGLDGTMRPLYKVEIKDDSGVVLATTTFTDPAPDLPNSIQLEQWKTLPTGDWITGSLNNNNSDYSEGEVIPFRLDVGGVSAGAYVFSICRGYEDGTIKGYLNLQTYNTSRAAVAGGTVTSTSGPFDGVNATITSFNEVGGQGGCNAGERETQVSTTLTGASTAYVLWGGYLAKAIDPGVGAGNGAASYPGASLHMGLVSPSKDRSINPSAIIELATITVEKVVDSGSATPDQWCFNISPNPNGETLPKCPAPATNSVTFLSLPTGSYQITETSIGGYSFASGSGTNCIFDGSTATALITAATTPTNATCTFHNAQDTGTIIVHKDVEGPNGEDITDTSQNFSVTLDGSDAKSFTDGGTVTYNNVTSGTHTIAESVIPTGYSLYSITPDNDSGTAGAQVTVTTGQTTDVYVVNRQLNATVTIHKNVINPDEGEVLDAHQFTVQRDGFDNKTIAEGIDAVYTVIPGTYTFTEVSDADYTLDSIIGDNDSNASNGATLTVGPGGSAELTFINKQKKATINVYKDVVKPDGQSPVSDDHTFTALLNGGTEQSFSENSPTLYTVNPGQYTITESPDGDYTELGCFLVTGGEATNFNTPSNSTINVTCKNAQKPATITVYKDVVKYDGSDTDDDNIFEVTLNSEAKPFSESGQAVFTVDPGTHGASESPETDYTYVSDDGPATVGSNGSATITIVNEQDPLSISGFKYDADGQTGLEGWTIELYSCLDDFLDCSFLSESTTDVDGSYIFTGLSTGLYRVGEFLELGWTSLSDLLLDIDLTTPGQNSENNNFVNFENVNVKVCKVVDADGDPQSIGDQTARFGWTVYLLVDGQTADTQTTGGDGCYIWLNLGPGHTYGVSEETPGGWTSLSDTSYSFGEASSGGNYEYTFVNFENATIIVHKNVLGTDGITDVDDIQTFTSLLDGLNGKTIAEGIDATYDDLGPGTYVVSEAPASLGYEYDSTTDGGEVPVESGGTYEITITNRQVSANLIVIKHVITDNGGNEDASDFTINVTGTNVSSTGFPGDENGTLVTLDAGTYSVDEDFVAGYTKTLSEDCSGEISFGETKYCTITNDDDAPSLTLIKRVTKDNGGDAVAEDWLLSADGPTPISGQGGAVSDSTFEAGTYTLSESGGPSGYTEGDWSCEGGDQEGDSITLGPGESAVCEITNDDIAPTVTLIKEVSGGDTGENEFGLTIDGQGVDSGQTVEVDANTPIELNEEDLDGYSFDSITGDEGCPTELGGTVTLGEGGSITCIIINTRDTGDISGFKFEDIDGDGIWDEESEPGLEGWTIELWTEEEGFITDTLTSDDPLGEYRFENIPTGDYTVCEVLEEGWTQTYPEGCHFLTLTQEGEQDLNFGNFELGLIGDFVWQDNNGDGNHDGGEPGISGVQVNLYLDDGDGIPELGGDDIQVGGTEITNLSGLYEFSGLGVGDYWVDIVDSTIPLGLTLTTTDPYGPITMVSGGIFNAADFGYEPLKGIEIEKLNDKSGGASAGDTVTYTLVITNTGNVAISNVVVTDSLPGGFEYVAGSTSILGASTVEPSQSGSSLTWDLDTAIVPLGTATITYQAKISSDLPAGTYKNYATCEGQVGGDNGGQDEPESIPCNTDDSDVPVGQTLSYGGKLTPQVLGATTELPATGSSTSLLLFALVVGGFGIFTKIKAHKMGRRKYAKN